MGNVFVVNKGLHFSQLWNTIVNLIDKKAIEKIKIVTNLKEEMISYLTYDQINNI